MLTFKEKLSAVFTTISAAWDGLIEKTKAASDGDWFLTLPSTSSSETYQWGELLLTIREKLGSRIIENIKGQSWTVTNKEYEGAFGVKRADIEDDKLGLIKGKVTSLFNTAKNFWISLVSDLCTKAYTTVCYDGQYFIDSDHPSLTGDGTTVSNTTSNTLSYDNLWTGISWFDTVKGPNGDPLDLEPQILMVGPSLRKTATELIENEDKPGGNGEKNTLRGRLKVVVNKKFVGSYASNWQIHAKFAGTDLTPFILQSRLEPEIETTIVKASGENDLGITSVDFSMFMNGDVLVGSRQRGAATMTFWPLVYGSNA